EPFAEITGRSAGARWVGNRSWSPLPERRRGHSRQGRFTRSTQSAILPRKVRLLPILGGSSGGSKGVQQSNRQPGAIPGGACPMSPADEASGIHPETLAVPLGVALSQMAIGHSVSRALYLAAKLGLADLLKDGPRDGRYLAAATQT